MRTLFIVISLALLISCSKTEQSIETHCYQCERQIAVDTMYCDQTEQSMQKMISWRMEYLQDTMTCKLHYFNLIIDP